MNEGVYVMNYSVAISMADTTNIDNLKDNETARTFVDNWVRLGDSIDKPLYGLFGDILCLGDAAKNLRQLKKGCFEALFQSYALKTGLSLSRLYESPALSAAINHYAGTRNLYTQLVNSDDFDPIDRLCLSKNNRSLLLAEVFCSLGGELISVTMN